MRQRDQQNVLPLDAKGALRAFGKNRALLMVYPVPAVCDEARVALSKFGAWGEGCEKDRSNKSKANQ